MFCHFILKRQGLVEREGVCVCVCVACFSFPRMGGHSYDIVAPDMTSDTVSAPRPFSAKAVKDRGLFPNDPYIHGSLHGASVSFLCIYSIYVYIDLFPFLVNGKRNPVCVR